MQYCFRRMYNVDVNDIRFISFCESIYTYCYFLIIHNIYNIHMYIDGFDEAVGMNCCRLFNWRYCLNYCPLCFNLGVAS